MDEITFIKPAGVEFPPFTTVIRAEAYLAFTEAEQTVQQALDLARNIERDAEDAYERRKKKGYEKGYNEARINASSHQFETAAKTIQYFNSLEDKVKNLVMQAIKKIINEIPDEEMVVKVIRNVLAAVRDQEKVKLWVCPKQVETVSNHIRELTEGHPVIKFIEVLSDARLKENDCILQTEVVMIDAGLDVQIAAIRRAIERSFDQFKKNSRHPETG